MTRPLPGQPTWRDAVSTLACLARYLGAVCVLAATVGCGATAANDVALPVVDYVDLDRYQGSWYEIASFPQSFQAGCTNTTATYRPDGDGNIEVFNRCLRDGEEHTATGEARVVDAATNAKLEVSFFWPFYGDYWIVDLGRDYEFAVIGHPGRDYLWILSRTPTMSPDVYASILQRLRDNGYDVGRLVTTAHPAEETAAASY